LFSSLRPRELGRTQSISFCVDRVSPSHPGDILDDQWAHRFIIPPRKGYSAKSREKSFGGNEIVLKVVNVAAMYEFGQFRMDPAERTLLREGESVQLVPKSFDVLAVLVENSGKLLDKNFLLSAVWSDTAVEENSLAKAIADIRRALGEGPKENRFIATVARRGYRFLPTVTRSELPVAAGPASEPSAASVRAESEKLTTLAVLPFTWLTQEGSDGSLAVGLADALITRLSNLPQLIVRPTSSILKYIDGHRDPAAVAVDLKADFVVTATLRQSSDRVRVTVQMVSPDQQRSVWADQFEEQFTHIFSVEDSISERVAAALALKLTPDQKLSLRRDNTRNNEAWQLYLRGRHLLSKRTLADTQRALEFFRQALALDSEYAQAWVGIADAYVLTGLHGALTGWLPPHETYPEAKRAALKAIELNDSLGEAHASLGFIHFFYDWDPPSAIREFRRALSLHPHYAPAHHWHAMACGFMGQHEESAAAINRALEIEPLSLLLNANRGYLFYFARRYDESIALLQTTLEMDASFAPTHHRLGLVLGVLGKHAEAIGHLREAHRLSQDSPQALGALGYLYGQAGNKAAAWEILLQLKELSKTSYVSAGSFAEIHLGLGEYAEVFEWLDKALDERTSALVRLKVDPRFDDLRSDPKFQLVLRNMKKQADPGRF
jgi:DNA-binding winged helix-turn-helix (wHTH) protein/Flp pilus assembly protein TadD